MLLLLCKGVLCEMQLWSFAWLLAPVVGGLCLGHVLGIAKHTLNDLHLSFLLRKQCVERRRFGVAVVLCWSVWVVWCETRDHAEATFGSLRGPRMLFIVNKGNVHRSWKEVLFGGRMSHRVYARIHVKLQKVLV